eukprot:544432_1
MGFPKISSLSVPGGKHNIFINDPKLIKYLYEDQFEISILKNDELCHIYYELLGKGIFVSNGPKWKFHRKVASHMFSMRNLKNFMFDMSSKHTLSTITKLKQITKDCAPQIGIDINDILGRFTLDTFCEIAFGQSVCSVNSYPKQDTFGTHFDDLVYLTDYRTMDIFWKIKKFLNIGTEVNVKKDHQQIMQFVATILDKKFKERKNPKQIYDATGSSEKYDLISLYLKHDPNMTRSQLYDVALNFIIAGRDTTRMLLSWFIYELCRDENKEILEKILREINLCKDEPTYSDFGEGFRYLECALCETMRLWPPVPINYKGCIKDVVLPIKDKNGKNYVIRKGDQVLIDHYVNGRDPKYWPNPLKFDPDRFDKKKGINTYDEYVYGVFNIAPRGCLGKKFAILEAKVFMYYFLKAFEVEKVKDKNVMMKTGAILNMATGFYVNLKERKM